MLENPQIDKFVEHLSSTPKISIDVIEFLELMARANEEKDLVSMHDYFFKLPRKTQDKILTACSGFITMIALKNPVS